MYRFEPKPLFFNGLGKRIFISQHLGCKVEMYKNLRDVKVQKWSATPKSLIIPNAGAKVRVARLKA